ncbi:MAG: SufD family Fe-S cluster assembly protein [Bacteroidales bacterium]|nr:SufD family Fe-S cluster assembly protein [Bacteroidales bacterium]
MIRRDILPDIWPDSWVISDAPQELHLAPSQQLSLVLCPEADIPPFQLSTDAGYTLLTSDFNHLQIHLAQGANLRLYRLQGMATPAQQLTHTTLLLDSDAHASIATITLGGQHVRNNIIVRLQGEGASLDAGGLYLLDRDQQCDNYIFVEHAAPHGTSNELYKGILDDSARARFNGHVLVQEGAVKTDARQTNRHILLTSKAHADARPFLEIYNDDVKCSHGSTTGQLDPDALFYLQTRGITRRSAITMLSYAFCDEVIRRIQIPALREAVSDMVKKRLHGELSTPCDECAIQCSSPCNGENASFHIDPSKL